MSVIQHLEELRTRIMIALGALVVGSIGGWFLYHQVFNLLTNPYCDIVKTLPKGSRPPTGCSLIVNGVLEPFLIRFKVTLFTGLALALPIVLYQLWRFITPGLTKGERKMAIPFVATSVLLFALGGWFAYITLPKGLRFLLSFTGGNLVPLLTVSKYVSFVLFMILAFGLSFEFPLVLIFLCLVRVLTSRQLREYRRWAWLGISVFAAVITPSQDPYTMLAMMIPMLVFYEVSILVARAFKR
jgi:sec-independent protein translocase protein TatC